MADIASYLMQATLWWPVLLIAVATIWGLSRVIYLRLKAGVNVLSFLARSRTTEETALATIGATIDVYLVLRAFYPSIDMSLFVFTLTPGMVAAGLVIMTVGILLMILSQAQMGAAWRIGVPTERQGTQKLVTDGVFRFSRNPIYLGVMMFMAGAVLLTPGPITIICCVACGVLINRLIRSEEAFMRAAFGDEYVAYCARVRRWL